jgi:undecaprenyl-diphosphatase
MMPLLQVVPAEPALSFWEAVIIGVVEGVTEFLPVSSTAHMILAARVLDLEQSEFLKSFEIIIQLGAILSVVVLYWKKFFDVEVIKKLIVAFIPTGVVGLTLYKLIKGYLLGNMAAILWTLLIGGIALIAFEKFKEKNEGEVDVGEITYRKALLIGLFQSIAILPGVSRSAATIVGGALIGISKRTIVEFSFMLAVPTMLAATVLELLKSQAALSGNFLTLGIGFVVSFLTAIIAIKSFLSFLKKRDFKAFGWYRIVLAVVFYLVFVR